MKPYSASARGVIVFLLSIVVLWYRAPDRFTHGFIWAEDAAVFMLDANSSGIHSLFHPYAGLV
jgi:hypothetical protein